MSVLLVLAAAAAANGFAAEAAPTAQRAGVSIGFARLDRNRDGVITANEAPRVARTRCDCLATPAATPASGGWIADFDGDGDARVTPQEFAARSAQPQASPR